MQFMDKDLISIQEARILVESALGAQLLLKEYDQETIDYLINEMIGNVKKKLPELVAFELAETHKGNIHDKLSLCEKFISELSESLKQPVIGVLDDQTESDFTTIGVPLGVVAIILPAENVMLNALFASLIALKAENTVILIPQPKTESIVLKLFATLEQGNTGLPKASMSCMENTTAEGIDALVNQSAVSLVINIDKPACFDLKTGLKPTIYGGIGSTPVFVERSANISDAARAIVTSRAFDNGLLPAAEQFVVAESVVTKKLKLEMMDAGAHFMSPLEERKLLPHLFLETEVNPAIIGKDAKALADMAGFEVSQGTKVLVSEQPYIFDENPFATALKCPIMAFYLEADWIHACDKCIQLLKEKQNGHTLAIHSNNKTIIKEFALKKPIGRMIVNDGASLAGIGLDSTLPVSLILGGLTTGRGFKAKNIVSKDLTYERMIGYKKCTNLVLLEKSEQANNQQEIFENFFKKIMK